MFVYPRCSLPSFTPCDRQLCLTESPRCHAERYISEAGRPSFSAIIEIDMCHDKACCFCAREDSRPFWHSALHLTGMRRALVS